MTPISISDAPYNATGLASCNGGVAVNAAVNAAAAQEVIAPIGQHRFDRGYTFTLPVNLKGFGNGAGPGTIFNSYASQFYANFTDGDIIAVQGVQPSIFRDMQFNSGVGLRNSGAAIDISGTDRPTGANNTLSVIDNVAFSNQAVCINLYNVWDPQLLGLYCYSWRQSAVVIRAQPGYESCGGNIERGYYFGDTSFGTSQYSIFDIRVGYFKLDKAFLLGSQVPIRLTFENFDAGAPEITNLQIEDFDVAALYIYSTHGSEVTPPTTGNDSGGLLLVDNLEICGDPGESRPNFQGCIMVADPGYAFLDNFKINNCRIRGWWTVGYGWIYLGRGTNGVIGNNTLKAEAATTVPAIYVGPNTDHIDVLDNKLIGFTNPYSINSPTCLVRDHQSGLTVSQLLGICRDGSSIYCVDGNPNIAGPSGGSTGAFYLRQGGAWRTTAVH